jgi:hypothetical protein
MTKPSTAGSKFQVGQAVEVLAFDFATPGFPETWQAGVVDRMEAIGDKGHVQVFVALTAGGWGKPVVGPRGGNTKIRAAR